MSSVKIISVVAVVVVLLAALGGAVLHFWGVYQLGRYAGTIFWSSLVTPLAGALWGLQIGWLAEQWDAPGAWPFFVWPLVTAAGFFLMFLTASRERTEPDPAAQQVAQTPPALRGFRAFALIVALMQLLVVAAGFGGDLTGLPGAKLLPTSAGGLLPPGRTWIIVGVLGVLVYLVAAVLSLVLNPGKRLFILVTVLMALGLLHPIGVVNVPALLILPWLAIGWLHPSNLRLFGIAGGSARQAEA